MQPLQDLRGTLSSLVASSPTSLPHHDFCGPPNATHEPWRWQDRLLEWARVHDEPNLLSAGLLGMEGSKAVDKAKRTLRGGLAHPNLANKTQLVRAIYIGVGMRRIESSAEDTFYADLERDGGHPVKGRSG